MNLFRNLIQKEDLELSKLTQEIADIQNAFETLKTENASLVSQIKDLIESLATKEEVIEEKQVEVEQLEEKVEQLEEVIEEKQEEVVQLEETVAEVIEKTVSVDELAAQKALEIVASAGVPVMETAPEPEVIDLMAQMKQLKGKELQAFYNANKAAIFKQQAK